MTWLVSIDESGNLGKDARFFVMAAVVTVRSRLLSSAVKKIPKKSEESKFYNCTDNQIMEVLRELSTCNMSIVYVVVDKHDYKGRYYGLHGNRLYEAVLSELLTETFAILRKSDVNVLLDRSPFISLITLRNLAMNAARSEGCNIMKCDKMTSHQSPCVQIADFVAGAINRNYEDGDSRFMDIIRKKISVARRN